MARLKYLLSLVLVCAAFQVYGHPLHLTFTNLEFNPKNSRWQLTIKVFSDDFSSNLKSVTGIEKIDEVNVKKADLDKALRKWVENRLLISFDNRPVGLENWKFEGITAKEDASWIRFEISAAPPTREIRVKNVLLLDLYPDQKNLFILVMGQTEAAHEFNGKDRETVISLNK